MLGFGTIHAVDVSHYEGADILADLNEPLPGSLRSVADLLIDPGTLEHCFNFPQALRNCADMLRVGGVVLHHSPIAGWLDHGYYTPSPCVFREFYEANGFDNCRTWVTWLSVKDRASEPERAEPYESPGNVCRTLPPGRRWIQYNLARKVRDVPAAVPQMERYRKWKGWEQGRSSSADTSPCMMATSP